MSISHLLEDFDTFVATGTHATLSDEQLEEYRLEAFEKGFQAGWDDATRAHADDNSHIGAELARNLQDLSFTYHEAHAHVMKSITPILQDMVQKILPEVAAQSLAPRIAEQITKIARQAGQQPILIEVATANEDRVATVIGEHTQFPVEVQGDPSLTGGQAFLRFGATEQHINLDEVLADITRALSGFFHESQKETVNG